MVRAGLGYQAGVGDIIGYQMWRASLGSEPVPCTPTVWLVTPSLMADDPEGTYRVMVLASHCYANAGASEAALDATFEALVASDEWEVVDRPTESRMVVVVSDLSLDEMEDEAALVTGVPGYGEYELWRNEFGSASSDAEV